jgi:hypothetical protein
VPINPASVDISGNRTLKQLRDDLMLRLGYAAQLANPPPGMPELLNAFLQDAQRSLIRRYPALRTERWFSWSLTAGVRFYDLTLNDEAATLPTPVISSVTTATVGGTIAAGLSSYRVAAVNAYGNTLASAAQTVTSTGATSANTINWTAVVAPAGASAVTGYQVFGRTGGSELLLASAGLVTTWVDTGSLAPTGALPTANTTAQSTKLIDPSRLTWFGYQRGNVRIALRRGIPETSIGYTIIGWPAYYDIRQSIEVWPAPNATEGTLILRGHFKGEAFAADADQTTIDDHAVFLLALANAKAHYGKPDAQNLVGQLEVYLQTLVAGLHGPARYIPGRNTRGDMVYSEPKPLVPWP